VSASAAATLGAIRTVRSFGGEALSFLRFSGDAAAAQASGKNLSKARAMLECVNRGCIYASLLLLYAVGGWLVRSGQVKVGSFIACIGYAFGLIFATQGVVNTAADAKAAAAALGRARDLVTSAAPDPALADVILADSSSSEPSAEESQSGGGKVDASDGDEAKRRRESVAAAGARSARAAAGVGDIELKDVHFAFPSRPDADVLTGVNLTLPQGQVTALVGSSGAGKSTITQLLCRFYDPNRGVIAVGGEDLNGFNRVHWLDAVALVGQEPVLFAGSVADNIRYGRAGATTVGLCTLNQVDP
jgi:ABC-type multidrug transport system fused ATPase/permease subunit